MSKPEFTPGPWSVIDHNWEGSSGVYGPDDYLIAEVTIHDSVTEENQTDLELIKEANARLIAAAPDMYEALLKARIAVLTWSPSPDEPLADIDAALAKAEGRAA